MTTSASTTSAIESILNSDKGNDWKIGELYELSNALCDCHGERSFSADDCTPEGEALLSGSMDQLNHDIREVMAQASELEAL